MSSDFEVAGYLTLSGSQRSLKITINGRAYYVSVADVQRALREPKFAAQVVCVQREWQPQRSSQSQTRLITEREP